MIVNLARGLLGLRVRGLVTDGHKEGPVWLAVETGRHQVGHVHDAQSLLQTPAQKVGVAHRHQKARSRELGGCRDQCHQVVIGFRDGVAEKADAGCVSGDSVASFDHLGRSLSDRVTQFAATIVPVDRRT